MAKVAAALLDRSDVKTGWYDVLDGDEPIDKAIDRLVSEGHDGLEGEDKERIWSRNV